MATREPAELAQLRARLARAVRAAGDDHPTTVAIRREYEAARTAHIIQDRLAGMAPLTQSEILTLTGLIEAAGDPRTGQDGTRIRRQANPDTVPLFDLDDDDDPQRQDSPDSGLQGLAGR